MEINLSSYIQRQQAVYPKRAIGCRNMFRHFVLYGHRRSGLSGKNGWCERPLYDITVSCVHVEGSIQLLVERPSKNGTSFNHATMRKEVYVITWKLGGQLYVKTIQTIKESGFAGTL